MRRIIFLIFLILTNIIVFSDGKVFYFSEDQDNTLKELSQDSQNAVISYINGIEELYLSIEITPDKTDNTIWILPLKVNEKDLKIEIIKDFPNITAKSIFQNNRFWQDKLFKSLLLHYFIFDLSIINIKEFYESLQSMGTIPKFITDSDKWYLSVNKIENMGMKLFYKTLKTKEELIKLLDISGKKLNLSDKELDNFDIYYNEKYTFVVGFIENKDLFFNEIKNRKIRPGIKAVFPSDKIYYPMKATMTYKKDFDVNIVISGNSELEEHEMNYTKEYFYESNANRFFENTNGFFTNFKFSNWKNRIPKDLYFNPSSIRGFPFRNMVSEFLSNKENLVITGYILFVIINLIIHLFILRIYGYDIRKYWKYGFFIVFTFLGMFYAYNKIEIENNPDYKFIRKTMKQKIKDIIYSLMLILLFNLVLVGYFFSIDIKQENLYMILFVINTVFSIFVCGIVKLKMFLKNRCFMVFSCIKIVIFGYIYFLMKDF